MSGFFWNVRGFNKPAKHSVIRSWVNNSSMQFGALLETRVKENKSSAILSSVFHDWSCISNYEFNNLGRIWVVWKDSVRLTPVYKSGQLITCSVLLEGKEEEFFCSFVYAANEEEERKELWDDLRAHHNAHMFRDKPWIICGDFNEILTADEHSNGANSVVLSQGTRDFQKVVQFCSLQDLGYHGSRFTWCNKRTEGLICKKLDRALVNGEWLNKYPNSYSIFESGGCSDHTRCRFNLEAVVGKKKIPFKFVNVLTKLPQFMPVIESYWNTTTPLFESTSALYRFSKKLKALKPTLREMAKEKLGDLTKRTKEAYDLLCLKQAINLANPTPSTMVEENEAFNKWQHLAGMEESFLKQRSKLHWLNAGDGNNTYFHKIVQQRRMRNSIREIIGRDGRRLMDENEVKNEAASYFEDYLNSVPEDYEAMTVEQLRDLLPFRCSARERNQLVQEISDEEIKKTLFSMPNDKSPGPDGFTTDFFKASWSIIGKDFIAGIKYFFTKGFLPKGLNTTILALIPKKGETREMKDYRPISCCNVIYKVISKLIANRLKVMLPKFINLNQSAFVEERLLMENVLLATEVVKGYHNEDVSPRCTMKLDISKAFDSVHWDFLLNTLSALEFPDQFIHWIRLCITTASFLVQVNGELAGFFQSSRGLRQGCALSPYLFVICMNVLSRLIDKAATNRTIGYHPRCKQIQLTHLCFADDIMVFVDGQKKSIEGVLRIFDEFAVLSGLKISIEKSSVYLAGISEERRDDIISTFPLKHSLFPVRYLGLPLLTKRMTATDYAPLVEKLKAKISSWTARHLSYAGRLQLLKSVIFSITNFWMSAFRLPSSCIKEIEKICSAFLWSGPELNYRKVKIAWSTVCKPKQEGGLGLRPLKEVNSVCCLKLLWRVLSKQPTLWVQWIFANYIKMKNIWTVKDNSGGSWMWSKILKYREVAKTLHKIDVHNGEDTSFWFDNWTNLGRLYDITGPRGFIDMGIPETSTVLRAIQTHRRRHHRVDFLNSIEEELERVASRLLPLEPDQHLWRSINNKYKRKFCTKDTVRVLRGERINVDWYGGVWFLHATPKYSFFTWLAAHNRLSTGDRMKSWMGGIQVNCVLCDIHEETRDHLFFNCTYTKEIWTKLAENLIGDTFNTEWNTLITTVHNPNFCRNKAFMVRYCFQATAYHIWRERNNRRHGEQAQTRIQLIKKVDKQIRNRLISIRMQGDYSLEGALEMWFATRPQP